MAREGKTAWAEAKAHPSRTGKGWKKPYAHSTTGASGVLKESRYRRATQQGSVPGGSDAACKDVQEHA